jgi:cytochrome c1
MKRQTIDSRRSTLLPLLVVTVTGLALLSGADVAADEPKELFVTSDTCMACHNGMAAADGADVSIGATWRASMMANAVRDPYWQAGVRRETLEHPEAAAVIEHECSVCHAPMTHTEEVAAGGTGTIFRHLPVGVAAGRDAALAADGVSCAACHQIQEDRFGEDESFGGGYVIDVTGATPRKAFGPYPADAGLAGVMHSATGFDQTESSHIQRSELCATCHTLFTHALGDDGQVAGTLPEQVPYLEWRHSDYVDSMSCQDCHMPELDAAARISSVLGEPQAAFSQHVFRGGNFVIPRILNRHRAELGTRATPQDLTAAVQRTRDHLGSAAATLAIGAATADGATLGFTVAVTNLAGHKVPTAYPSRRAWLHVRVEDGGGGVIFESGAPEPTGAIRGNDNDADPARFEPHYAQISDPGEVQIYEDILQDAAGAVTTGLLRGVSYVKDNRLLPEGFEKEGAPAAVAVQGAARDDDDFEGGGDRVRYAVPLAGATGPYTVRARLLYQPIGYRWAMNLGDYDAEEPRRFLRYWGDVSATSMETLAEASFTVVE